MGYAFFTFWLLLQIAVHIICNFDIISPMKRKILFLCSLFFFSLATSFARAGIGASFTLDLSLNPAPLVSLTAKTDTSPWTFFFNVHPLSNTLTFFADNWFINERMAEHLEYYVFWGPSGGFTFDDGSFNMAMGARIGAGLDFFFFRRHLELFTQTAWNPYFGLQYEDGSYGPLIHVLSFPITAGLRLWY